MLTQSDLSRTLFPVGDYSKPEVRRIASDLGLRTALKPDSQDVCFITSAGGRVTFLGERIPLRPGRVVDTAGHHIGEVEAIELITVGQRKGIGLPGGGPKRYVVDVDPDTSTVVVGADVDLLRSELTVDAVTWVDGSAEGPHLVQSSAHGEPVAATIETVADGVVKVVWDEPQRRIAPGQSVVFYDLADVRVIGGGVAGADQG
jgi:tRNA-specific 2-thiouridylase